MWNKTIPGRNRTAIPGKLAYSDCDGVSGWVPGRVSQTLL